MTLSTQIDEEYGALAKEAEAAPCPPAADDNASDCNAGESDEPCPAPSTRKYARRWACLVCVITAVALGAVCGLFVWNLYQAHRAEQKVAHFLEAARQAALNLTTIGHTTAERDVARIVDSSTAPFVDDFRNRSQQFIELVKHAQTDTVGTVVGAGLESVDKDKAKVLVAVSVKTSNAAAPQQEPRLWRMRIEVQETSTGFKASNVDFVP
ncbi:hypothetical protein AWC05_05705 [Mycobacterium florentinum]|uniref:Mce protein n=1 Tax=Mycobacterium florentinum TaxID=292462 RepID=A0A1X1TTX5_MYCFL|nr:hypothetical protein [Mycobacterium florentinum]MCV7408521.1 mammalian cell entry protein [Mycobacterium florentinum]ORV48044.1 hypothetical protein AWC05_05705 [Mycobacterium florentinum]BBX77978.1 Mce associated membrane protein [Mycobacterium florentinum]